MLLLVSTFQSSPVPEPRSGVPFDEVYSGAHKAAWSVPTVPGPER
jgi:hypothetical protein